MRHHRLVSRRKHGFTLMELLTVIIIIGILGTLALANFLASQQKAKNASVMNNMHLCQVAAESYGAENSGCYPSDFNELKPFYPQGSNTKGGAPGILPQNPITGATNENLYQESIKDSAEIMNARSSAPAGSPGTAGQVGYNLCDNPPGTSYCVTGTDSGGNRLGSGGRTIVLSNQ